MCVERRFPDLISQDSGLPLSCGLSYRKPLASHRFRASLQCGAGLQLCVVMFGFSGFDLLFWILQKLGSSICPLVFYLDTGPQRILLKPPYPDRLPHLPEPLGLSFMGEGGEQGSR